MTTNIEIIKLTKFLNRCFLAANVSKKNAAIITKHLIEAEMRGIYSHGLNRLSWYLNLFQTGELKSDAIPNIKKLSGNTITVDGDGGIGIIAMDTAVSQLIKMTSKNLISMAGITNCGHTGRLGAYAEKAAKTGCFVMCMGGGGREKWASVVPFGGINPIMSTNPFAFSMPGSEVNPVSSDFAISTIAAGKIAVAKANNTPLPDGAIINSDGHASRNPDDFYAGGALLPAAGPKGSGMGIIAELVGNAMLGSALEFNWLIICMRVDAFQPISQYKVAVSKLSKQVRKSSPATGHQKVLMPGDLEEKKYQDCVNSGYLSVSNNIAKLLIDAAQSVGQKGW
ncbi:MAG: Ldh family oxidoreductase [Paracoccaceae bacterium]|nr:Ldh family oxidoreductase [Paracoccaceae bacterium]